MTSVPLPSEAIAQQAPRPGLLRDLASLAKPGITLTNVTTAAGGYFLSPGPHDLWRALWTLCGVAMLVGGAGALNCYLERDVDARMRRTRTRPLPMGRLAPSVALVMGVGLVGVSVPMLTFAVDPLAGLLGAIALVTYVLVYTPLKGVTALSTHVGAVPGAMPPLLGWAAATGELSPPGLALFAVLFLWQIPHFHAIALFRKHEYLAAGLRTLPLERGDAYTRAQSAAFIALLVPTSLLLAPLGLAGTVYLVAALALGIWFSAWGVLGLRASAGASWARGLFRTSLLYLVGLFAALLVDRAF